MTGQLVIIQKTLAIIEIHSTQYTLHSTHCNTHNNTTNTWHKTVLCSALQRNRVTHCTVSMRSRISFFNFIATLFNILVLCKDLIDALHAATASSPLMAPVPTNYKALPIFSTSAAFSLFPTHFTHSFLPRLSQVAFQTMPEIFHHWPGSIWRVRTLLKSSVTSRSNGESICGGRSD